MMMVLREVLYADKSLAWKVLLQTVPIGILTLRRICAESMHEHARQGALLQALMEEL